MNLFRNVFLLFTVLLSIASPALGNPLVEEEHFPIGIVMIIGFAACVFVFSQSGGFFAVLKACDKNLYFGYLGILTMLTIIILVCAPMAILLLVLFVGIFHGVLMIGWGFKSISKDRPSFLENTKPFQLFKGALGSFLPFIGMVMLFVLMKGCR